MRASITSLRPRQGCYDRALAAFRAARFQACISELHGLESIAATALRSRAYLRTGKPAAALEAVARQGADSNRDRAELALLRAVAASRLGDEAGADRSFVDARVYGISSANVAMIAEASFYLALRAFGRRELRPAIDLCHRVFEDAATRPMYGTVGGDIPLPHIVARTQVLLGVINAVDGRYRDQLSDTLAALATLDEHPVSDVYEAAFAIRNLAILSRDFDLEEAPLITARADALAWSSEIAPVKFTTFEELGWCAALKGDVVCALQRFRTASATASTPPEEILIAVDRALVARELGHRAMAIEECEHALKLADIYAWESAAGDTRLVLLPLAQIAAWTDPVCARRTLERYGRIRNAMDERYAARIEARVSAEEQYTHGVVLRAEGRTAASIERLELAFTTWSGIGYDWRAARAALELAELSAGNVFRLAVARELRRRPESVFSARARQVA